MKNTLEVGLSLTIFGLFIIIGVFVLFTDDNLLYSQNVKVQNLNCANSQIHLPIIVKNYYAGVVEQEENNTIGQANGPLIKNMAYKGNLDDRGLPDEFDFYKFHVPQYGNISVTLKPSGGATGPDFEKKDVQLLLFFESTSKLRGYKSTSPYKIDTVIRNGELGWYYILVGAPSKNLNLSYTIEVNFPSNSGSIISTPIPTCVPSPAPTPTPTPTISPTLCEMAQPSPRSIIIPFREELIVSHLDEAHAKTSEIPKNIPSGIYKITLTSYDDHGEANEENQKFEIWELIFYDSNHNIISRSSSTDDLDEELECQDFIVDEFFELEQTVSYVRGFHSAFNGPHADKKNSVYPSHAILEPVSVSIDENQ